MLTKYEITKIAQDIVDENLNEGTPIKKCIMIKIQGMDLNPEQLKRIVEAVNLQSFVKRYEDAAPEEKDNASDFDVVEPREILSDQVKESVMKTASHSIDYMDYYSPPPGAPQELMEKVAQVIDTPQEVKPHEKNRTLSLLKQAIEHSNQKMMNAYFDYEKTFGKLAGLCRTMYFDYNTLQKNAMIAFGEQAMPHLNVLAKHAKIPEPAETYAAGNLKSDDKGTYPNVGTSLIDDQSKLVSEQCKQLKVPYPESRQSMGPALLVDGIQDEVIYDEKTPGFEMIKKVIKLSQEIVDYKKVANYLFNTREHLAHKWGLV